MRILRDDQKWNVRLYHAARPGSELAGQTNIQRPEDVTRPVLRRSSRIENEMPTALHFLNCFGMERDGFRQFIDKSRTLEIDSRITAKVRGSFRQIRGHHLDEGFSCHWLERVVEAALLTDCGGSFARNVAAAHRAGAVGWKDLRLIRKGQKFVLKRVVQHRSEFRSRHP